MQHFLLRILQSHVNLSVQSVERLRWNAKDILENDIEDDPQKTTDHNKIPSP